MPRKSKSRNTRLANLYSTRPRTNITLRTVKNSQSRVKVHHGSQFTAFKRSNKGHSSPTSMLKTIFLSNFSLVIAPFPTLVVDEMRDNLHKKISIMRGHPLLTFLMINKMADVIESDRTLSLTSSSEQASKELVFGGKPLFHAKTIRYH